MNFWQGERIRLRGVEPADAAHFHRWNQDSDTARNLDFVWPPVSLAQVVAWADEQSKRKFEDDSFHWVIEDLERRPVGSISTHDCSSRNGTFSYGIGIGSEHRRRGYGAEAIELVLNYYFNELRYQKVTVSVHADNPGSVALHERLGFRLEGTLRRMHFSGGRFTDVHWFGQTVEEWRERC